MARVTRSLPMTEPDSEGGSTGMACYAEVLTDDTTWEKHSHPFHELLWNERGASSAVVGSRVWTITPAVGLWMPAGTPHSASAFAGTWLRACFIGSGASTSMSGVPAAVEMTPLLRLLLERLCESELTPRSRQTTEAMLLDVLTPSPRELIVHAPASALLAPIADAVRRDPADPRSLGDWAAELGVSARTVSRAFIAETGTSFARWVTSVRAQHAVGLLARGWDVEAVARKVGYRSANAFGVAFRRTTGFTPGTFRGQ